VTVVPLLPPPFDAASLPLLRTVQSADRVYIVDGRRPPQRLSRIAADNWTIEATPFKEGPFGVENDDEAFSGYQLVRVGPDAVKRTHASGGTVEAVVLKLAGGVRKKLCAACGVNKALDEFCKRTDMPDGREYRCKKCEAKRVKAHTARKAAERGDGVARKAAG
jgi:hypothetical protein